MGATTGDLMMGFSRTKCIHAYSARHDIYPACLGNWAPGAEKNLESRIAAHSSNV